MPHVIANQSCERAVYVPAALPADATYLNAAEGAGMLVISAGWPSALSVPMSTLGNVHTRRAVQRRADVCERGWREYDAAAFAALYSEGALWQQHPFREPGYLARVFVGPVQGIETQKLGVASENPVCRQPGTQQHVLGTLCVIIAEIIQGRVRVRPDLV
jgi:hypothetical protein